MMKFLAQLFISFVFLLMLPAMLLAQKIDRKALVSRHNIIIKKFDSLASLSIGNGDFAFTVDATGLQSFPTFYENGVPLGTQSSWGWHSFPNNNNYQFKETLQDFTINGKVIPYSIQSSTAARSKEAVEYFRVNPHRLQLGQIGIILIKQNGAKATIADIKNIDQTLDLWKGIITSRFTLEGVPVEVQTMMHSDVDEMGCIIKSKLLNEKRIQLSIRIPTPNAKFKDVGNYFPGESNEVAELRETLNGAALTCTRNASVYKIGVGWKGKALMKKDGKDSFVIIPDAKNIFSTTFIFSPKNREVKKHSALQVKFAAENYWLRFWQKGGAVDFSGSKDPRAKEIERRVVLSQYLTRIQCASKLPPQETGLVYNSWYGKPHLEMHWWHAVHFAQWGRHALLEKSLNWYETVSGKAFEIAKRQGFKGLRWQKMVDPQGNESPSSVGAFLIWQQPHFIYMAEMLYRKNKDPRILNKYREMLFATADFMASFPTYDSIKKQFNLGKGLIPAQECFDPATTFNPTYELAYWHWALNMAQTWRVRLGMTRNKEWDNVLNQLAPYPIKENLYLAAESVPDCYTNPRYLADHPAVLGAFSTLPAVHGMDTVIMKNTLLKILDSWNWEKTWGWDYPLTAMTAARLNMPEVAVDALLKPVQKNTYLQNGHNFQDDRLTIYLPGNGGLLSAVAMMCTGVDGSAEGIGFPKNKDWNVRWEGLHKMF